MHTRKSDKERISWKNVASGSSRETTPPRERTTGEKRERKRRQGEGRGEKKKNTQGSRRGKRARWNSNSPDAGRVVSIPKGQGTHYSQTDREECYLIPLIHSRTQTKDYIGHWYINRFPLFVLYEVVDYYFVFRYNMWYFMNIYSTSFP